MAKHVCCQENKTARLHAGRQDAMTTRQHDVEMQRPQRCQQVRPGLRNQDAKPSRQPRCQDYRDAKTTRQQYRASKMPNHRKPRLQVQDTKTPRHHEQGDNMQRPHDMSKTITLHNWPRCTQAKRRACSSAHQRSVAHMQVGRYRKKCGVQVRLWGW